MDQAAPVKARFTLLERYAWVGFVLLAVIFFLFGVTDYFAGGGTYGEGEAPSLRGIAGVDWNSVRDTPAGALIDHDVRTQALWMTMAGVWGAVIAAIPLRGGQRWAWFTMLAWPLLLAAIYLTLASALAHPSGGTPPPLVSAPILIAVSVLLLGLTFRSCFAASKRQKHV